jgi:hypothetical protein
MNARTEKFLEAAFLQISRFVNRTSLHFEGIVNHARRLP